MAESPDLIQLTEESFDREVLESAVPVLVDFWAPWCAPCRIVGPSVEQIATEFSSRAKVAQLNVDDAPAIVMRYDVVSIPTIAYFRGGKLVDSLVGVAPKDVIADALRKLIA